MNVEIIFENENVLAVNKPSGLKVHADQTSSEQTLVDWIIDKYPQTKGVGEPLILQNGKIIDRPGIVHRIDKDTSGVLIIAKTEKSFANLKSQFQNRSVSKKYRVIVYGTAKKDSGVIDTPIGRSSKDFRQKSVKKIGAKGAREAQTKYKVLAKGEDYSYIEASPKTGRTHQIRVHLKSIGHPVVCDSLYAPGKECPAILGRQALHAYSISLTSQQGEQINIECPVPEDMANMLAEAKLVC